MDEQLKMKFETLWKQYFAGAPLPIVFFYTDDPKAGDLVKPPKVEHKCVIADIARARTGRSLLFNTDSIGCFGGKRYLGFSDQIRPGFEYFLSYGIPGEMEGERYKKSPEIVNETYKQIPSFTALGKYIVFKRWDKLSPGETPEAVIFFNTPDVVSGIFTLSNFDVTGLDGVRAPFGAGCAQIVLYPYLENKKDTPQSILGMFDVSARPCVPSTTLTITVPMKKFITMIGNMEESFLTTHSWEMVRKRIKADQAREK